MEFSSPTDVPAVEPVESVFAWIFGTWLLTSLVVFVILLMCARLIVFLPANRDARATREFARSMRQRGYWLTASGALVVGLGYSALRLTDDALFSAVLVVVGFIGLVLSAYGALALSVGLATSPRVDARTVSPDGQSNPAWAIDVLTQIRSAHGASGVRAASHGGSNQPDFGKLIDVADKSGNGMASLVAAVFQLLLNTSPWLIDVTVLDGLTAAVVLRRNGHDLEEEVLKLPFGDVSEDHHRELLTMAATFAAIRVAARYTDINGFYGVENWRSSALTSVAMITSGSDRQACINQALEEDPSNLVAEYEEVFEYANDQTDATVLMQRIDRLEPMIDLAAVLCGEDPVLEVAPMPWHEDAALRSRRRLAGEADAAPPRLQWLVSVFPTDRRRVRDAMRPEPPLMMLRLMLWYLSSVRNWLALERSRTGKFPEASAPQGDGGPFGLRVAVVLGRMVAELKAPDAVYRLGTEAANMRMTAAIDAEVLRSWAHLRFDLSSQVLLGRWLRAAEVSTDLGIQHSLGCLYAQQLCGTDDALARDELSSSIEACLAYAHFKPYWEDWSIQDPELRLAGGYARIREVVLFRIQDPWNIERFAAVRDRLPVRALLDPTLLTERVLAELSVAADMTHDAVQSIGDGAAILRAAREPRLLDEVSVLRAVRYLLDDKGHDVNSLLSGCEFDIEQIVDGVAEAVYWVPSAGERRVIARFVRRLVNGVDGHSLRRDGRSLSVGVSNGREAPPPVFIDS
jgi:hypothetical protein